MESTSYEPFPHEVIVGNEKLTYAAKLGEGAYGLVYLYQNATKRVALKIATERAPQGAIYRESYYLKKLHLAKINHTPAYYGEGIHNGQNYVILEYVEYSIEEYTQQFGDAEEKRLAIVRIGQQMIEAVKEIHEAGYLHQDIKPDNFRITKDGLVKILDFGLINEYKPSGRHKSLCRYGFQGTPYFGSIRSLEGYTLSRRDDLESIGYMMMFLLYPESVPWKQSNNYKDILKQKQDSIKTSYLEESKSVSSNYIIPKTDIKETQDGSKLQILIKFVSKAHFLEYEQDPDYAQFTQILQDCELSLYFLDI
ncbi:hypothetical protein FGO68_gene2107 [Halteria grandinella]|uniref:Casein kinase I n=1 Tax=Halteria grandinella TaxID=5974 RepID=A0A8J8SWY9_HALGN|nr:hypothetical protein FGO68_gene2107 [Halteria grandinella]